MAAYSRIWLLLLLTLPCLCRFGSVLGFKATNRAAEPPNASVHRPAVPPVKNAPALAAGASQPRRATGWKLSEEEACREDLTRLCPKHTWANNLAVLECLQDRREVRHRRHSRAGLHRCCEGVAGICWVCRPGGSDPHRLSPMQSRNDDEVNLRQHAHAF